MMLARCTFNAQNAFVILARWSSTRQEGWVVLVNRDASVKDGVFCLGLGLMG